MQESTQGNAMTEVALALAMGFFSILVLALVSMGAGQPASDKRETTAALLKPALARSDGSSTTLSADDRIVIYYQDKFLDPDLSPTDLASLPPEGRVILAFDPAIPLDEVVALYGRIERPDLIVSTLDAAWLARLEAETQSRGVRP